MALKFKTIISSIFRVAGTPEKARLDNVLPGLKRGSWYTMPKVTDFHSAHANKSRNPGGNMLYILPKDKLSLLGHQWLPMVLELGHTVIVTEGNVLHLYNAALGSEIDKATLNSPKADQPFLWAELEAH